jgi:hypothetical protein
MSAIPKLSAAEFDRSRRNIIRDMDAKLVVGDTVIGCGINVIGDENEVWEITLSMRGGEVYLTGILSAEDALSIEQEARK